MAPNDVEMALETPKSAKLGGFSWKEPVLRVRVRFDLMIKGLLVSWSERSPVHAKARVIKKTLIYQRFLKLVAGVRFELTTKGL